MRRNSAFHTAATIVLVLLSCALTISAQTHPPSPPPIDPSSADKSDDNKTGIGSMEEEMRARRAIRLSEKEYKDNVERARAVAELGAELNEAAEEGRSFGREETKKLERIEKLAKKIRTEAGGSDEDSVIDDPPGKLQSALSRLAEVSASLCKTVEKTPRQVISATVIDQANAVLQLSKLVRRLFH
jgi:hypothetical protein